MSPTAPALYSNKATNGRRMSVKIEIRMHEVHELLLLPWQAQKQFPISFQHNTAERKLCTRSRDATLETALTIKLLIKNRFGVTVKLPVSRRNTVVGNSSTIYNKLNPSIRVALEFCIIEIFTIW